MRQLLLAASLGTALALTACATATPYQPIGTPGARGGYADERIGDDRFRVAFAGNSVTSRDTVEMYLFFRAAELTLESGNDCFETVNRVTDRDTRYVGTPDPFWRGRPYGPYWRPYWRSYSRFGWSRWDPYWGDDWDVREVTRYEANAEVIVRKGPCPAGDRYVFDARQVVADLGPRVVRPEPR